MKNIYYLSVMIMFLIFTTSCDDDETTPISINFSQQEIGISSDNSSETVDVILSRTAGSGGTITLTIQPSSLTYGETEDFYTEPAAVAGVITLEYAANEDKAEVSIFMGSSLNIDSDESVEIDITEVSGNTDIGANGTLTVDFSENFVAPSGILEMSAGGEDFTHQAFVDLSKLAQTNVDKLTWDLGFYSEAGAFNVVLNAAGYAMARALYTNDMNVVTEADTAGFAAEMVIPQFNPGLGSIDWVDTPDGNLATTAFGEISATDGDNMVHIIKRDGGRNWKKVRVIRNGEGYTIEHADISSATFESLVVTKNDEYNFTFVDLDNGLTSVEPKKGLWDIMYSTYTVALNLGGPGLDIPYGFKDYIILNRYNTSVAMVMIADIAYEDFDATDVAEQTFESEIDAIGSSWRMGGGPGTAPSLFEDRYFVIKDSDDYYYKVQFTRLTSLTGERGFPEFKFEIVE